MTPQELEAAINKAVTTATAPMAATIAKQEEMILILKMSPQAQAHYAKLNDDAAKKAFAAKKPAEQDADADDAKKREIEKTALSPEVKEVLKRTETLAAENVELKKRLDVASEKESIADFAKRATDLGLVAADGEIMRKAYGGDTDAQKKLDEKIRGLAKQANPLLFTEIGKGGDTGGKGITAYDQLMSKTDELRKSDAGKSLSREQAFAKVYTDPSNKDLVATYKQEDMAKRQRSAA